jgi:hypothetical protein
MGVGHSSAGGTVHRSERDLRIEGGCRMPGDVTALRPVFAAQWKGVPVASIAIVIIGGGDVPGDICTLLQAAPRRMRTADQPRSRFVSAIAS